MSVQTRDTEYTSLDGGAADAGRFKLYPQRFLVLGLYFAACALPGMMQNSFAPVQDDLRTAYDKSEIEVNLLAMSMPAMNIVTSFFVSAVFDAHGLRKGLAVNCATLLVGGWMRYLGAAVSSFWLLVAGQVVVALGMPFALAGSTLLSDSWFSEDGRAIATAVGSLANIIGSVVASVLAPGFFSEDAPRDTARADCQTFMLVEAIAATVIAVATVALVRDRPPTPPSASALASSTSGGSGMSSREIVTAAFSNVHFVILWLTFSLGYSALNAFTTDVNLILKPLGYSDTDIGNIGSALGAGIVGSVVIGVITDITKRFALIVKVCGVLAAGSFFWLYLALYADTSSTHLGLCIAAVASVGFWGIPLVPVIMELAIETLFPLTEAAAANLLWLGGNGVGLAVVIAATLMEGDSDDPNAMRSAFIFLLACFGAGVFLVMFWNGPLLRQEHERKQAAGRESPAPARV